jgi:hypothetical protein
MDPMITTVRRKSGNALGWLLGCAVGLMPMTAAAQATIKPAERPLVTAENERWYLEGQPITYSGSFYYLAGAAVFFNPYEMVRTGDYRGIPLYALATRDPFGVVYVPVARGLMQPYERRRDGDVAGTVGGSAPSFPVDRDSEATLPDGGLQAAGPPDLGAFHADSYGATDDRASSQPAMAATRGTSTVVSRPVGPLTTALKPTGLNAFYIEYQGRRWFSNGPAVVLDPAAYTRAGEYHGFPVYVTRDPQAEAIYVAVTQDGSGLLTPYSARK